MLFNIRLHIVHQILIFISGYLIPFINCLPDNPDNILLGILNTGQSIRSNIHWFYFFSGQTDAFHKFSNTKIGIHDNVLPEDSGLHSAVVQLFKHLIDKVRNLFLMPDLHKLLQPAFFKLLIIQLLDIEVIFLRFTVHTLFKVTFPDPFLLLPLFNGCRYQINFLNQGISADRLKKILGYTDFNSFFGILKFFISA